MKKLFSILLALVLTFTLASCGNTTQKGGSNRQAPTFTGVEDKTINVGDKFAVLEGVKAFDADGKEIAEIAFENPVDPKKAGTYTVTYTATDSFGVTGTASRVITVVKQDKEGPMISGAGDVELIICGEFNKMKVLTSSGLVDRLVP